MLLKDMLNISHERIGSVSRLIIGVLFLLAFAWRIRGLTQESLWRDEIDALYFALGDPEWLLTMFIEPGHNGPLYFFCLRAWLHLVGASEFALRYLSLLLGVLTIPMTWQVGRQLLPISTSTMALPSSEKYSGNWPTYWLMFLSEPSLLAATFLAVNPYQLWYSQEGKMYTAITFIVLVAICLFLKSLKQPASLGTWLSLTIILILGIYTHLLFVLLVPLLAIWFLISFLSNRKQSIGILGFLFALLTVFMILSFRGSWILSLLSTSDSITGRPFFPWRFLLQETIRYQLNGVSAPAQGGIWLIPMIVLATVGLLYSHLILPVTLRKTDRTLSNNNGFLIIATWLVLPMIGIYLLSLLQPVFAPRYIIWIAPAFMLALALGIQVLQPGCSLIRQRSATFIVMFIIGHGLITGLQQKKSTFKPDLRQAVNYLVQRREPEELLIFQIPHLEYAYRYYTGTQYDNPFENSEGRLGRSAGGLWTNHDMNDSETMRQVEQEMHAMTQGVHELWVLRSEVEMWDSRDLMDQWLRQNGHRLDVANFYGVQVIHYEVDS